MFKRPGSIPQDLALVSSVNPMPKQDGGMRLQLKSIVIHCLRFLLYKIIACLRTCRNIAAQMWINSSVQNVYTSLPRSKKALLFGTLVLIGLLYFWLHWLRWPTSRTVEDPMDMCLGSKLESFRKALEQFDAVVSHKPLQPEEVNYLPYIGNGYVGTTVGDESQVYIRRGRTLSQPVNYYPIVQVSAEGLPSKEAFVTDLKSGLVYKLQCFQLESLCVSVASQFYAHRAHPGLIVQEFRVHNPTDLPVTMEFRHVGVSDWQGSTSLTGKTTTGRSSEVEYRTVKGTVVSETSQSLVYDVAVSHSRMHDTATVKPSSTIKRHVYTAVRYKEQVGKVSEIDMLANLAEQDLKSALNTEPGMLRSQHVGIWTGLWRSGFGISLSRAVGALNGDKINMTIYYVMSHSPTAVAEPGVDQFDLIAANKLLYYPDRCYEGHHTLQNAKMWEEVVSPESLVSQVNTWLITLEKQGCSTLVRAGAEGVLQAMMLSFGALRFKNDHLEFGAHPKDLHRDYFFRRINYGNNTHVNITVLVGEDNRANLFVALDRNDKPYYACDAGCLDAPVKLTNDQTQFAVKLTDPHTSILYITYDRQHMEDLKHAIHFKAIIEAPAHEHHVIALHRHGHHYGGLPKLFWISIGFLILVFHLFLFKLIFNEYCQSPDSRYHRGKYSL